MNVKAVVKVMNFHALLRVENSGQEALKYSTMEDEAFCYDADPPEQPEPAAG